jgi:hypothetical protein
MMKKNNPIKKYREKHIRKIQILTNQVDKLTVLEGQNQNKLKWIFRPQIKNWEPLKEEKVKKDKIKQIG